MEYPFKALCTCPVYAGLVRPNLALSKAIQKQRPEDGGRSAAPASQEKSRGVLLSEPPALKHKLRYR
ncbi:uncharacterized [Tachysurus ichikawai]